MQIRDDLERESDYSGSGLGPDDEDSIHAIHRSNTNLNSGVINNNQRNKDNNLKRQQTGLSGSTSGGSNANSNNNNNFGGGGFAGSGDGGDQDNDDEDDDDDNDDGVNMYPGPGDNDEDEDPDDDLVIKDDEEEELEDHSGKLDFDLNTGRKQPPIDPSTSDDEDLDSQCMAYYLPIIFTIPYVHHFLLLLLCNVGRLEKDNGFCAFSNL